MGSCRCLFYGELISLTVNLVYICQVSNSPWRVTKESLILCSCIALAVVGLERRTKTQTKMQTGRDEDTDRDGRRNRRERGQERKQGLGSG